MDSRPNVLWITLDSVRQDHTSIGGYDRDTTPQLRELADGDRGWSYDECISTGIYTLSSSASILTGTYPTHNTVGIEGGTLPEELPTVAELFSAAGYRTACLSRNSHISSATGLDRGFDRFEWIAASTLLSAAGLRTLTKYLANIRHHSTGFTLDTAKHATPYIMNDLAKRWLRDLTDEAPFFFYLHYNEPHRPYVPPIPYQDRFTDGLNVSGSEAVDIAMDIHESLYERVATGRLLTEREREALVAMYDAEVCYTDECIGRLVEFTRSLTDDTIIVITADHGELFGEQDVLAHKLVLDDALINVPLIVVGMDVPPATDELVQHVDLMRMLLDRVGADTDSLQGVNLEDETREYAIAQRAPADFEEFIEHEPAFDTERYHSSVTTALRTHEYKYVYSDDGSELFELPNETADVSEEFPEVRETLHDRLTEWLTMKGEPITEAREAEFSDEMRRQLDDLGYLS